MRILIVGNYYYPEHTGGVEVVSFNLVKHYRALGHHVRWMAADVLPNFRSLQDGDVPIRAWNFAEERLGFPCPIPVPKVFERLYRSLSWADVLHLQDCLYPINILAFCMAKGLRRSIMLTQYAKLIPYAQAYKRCLQRIAYGTIGRLMFAGSDQLAFITSNVRDAMAFVSPPGGLPVVPLGVDTDSWSPLSDPDRAAVRSRLVGDSSKPLLLFVGRMVQRKGVSIVRHLVAQRRDWHWVLVGRADDFDPASWPQPNLTYCPWLEENELRRVFGAADLLVHPSIGEGLTLTASECMAAGTPVVISPESLTELPEEDRKLFLAATPDADDVHQAIERYLSLESSQVATMRDACRRFAVGRLSWRAVAEEYARRLLELKTAHVIHRQRGEGS